MYLPEHFVETDLAHIDALMAAFPLACIVAQTASGLVANHIPLRKADDKTLVGHIAFNNDMHRDLDDGQQVLTIFRGQDAYVSPNLYPSKAEHHRVVPTWNYQAVHIHGTIRFQHDTKTKRAAVGTLTRDHETRANGAAAWRMADAPPDYMATMLDGIVAFRISIDRVLAKSKLSQNRNDADKTEVRRAFDDQGLAHLARAMQRDPEDGSL